MNEPLAITLAPGEVATVHIALYEMVRDWRRLHRGYTPAHVRIAEDLLDSGRVPGEFWTGQVTA